MSTGIGSNASALKTASSASTAANGALSKQDKDRQTIAQNFDAFLSLLTTQLKNQSPLDPLDANQFTQQLVQFSSVEQQLKTNDLLATMAKGIGDGGGQMNAATAASLIGVKVAADASTTRLMDDGSGGRTATYPVTVQSNYKDYQVEIRNATGDVVYSGAWQPAGTGEQTYTWKGLRSNGAAADPEDKYTIAVSGALVGGGGARSRMSTERSGVVTAVDFSGTEAMVQFGGLTLPLSQIKKVSKA